MSSVNFTKIAFEPEDFPPPSYLSKDADTLQNDGEINNFAIKPLPPSAIAAPEFVPKVRQFQPPPYLQAFHPQPQFVPPHPQLILPPTPGPMLHRFPMVHPFRMRSFMPQMIPINRPPPNRGPIPPGYAADITALNSGVGPPIAAIVLRKRRKKKNRSRNKERQSQQFEDKLSSDGDGHHSDRETDELKCDKNSDKRRSEPDLMKMLPKDLDMNSSNSALLQDSLITTSCPDLSEAQKLLLDLHLDELALMEDAYEAHLENLEKNNPQSVQVYPDCFEGEMELDSNPVVLSAMVDNVYQNSKKSAALKSLDEQIMREMRLDDKLAKKLSNEDSDEELFDRLVNNTNANEKLTVGQTNLSLFEEFAEKELFDKLNKANQMKKSQSDTFASVKTHLQVDKKGNAQPYASERAKEIADLTENRFNNSSYLDKKSGMQIIVNAMNGNEELEVLSDDNFSTLGSPKSRAESAGSKTNLHYPASKTCCSLM